MKVCLLGLVKTGQGLLASGRLFCRQADFFGLLKHETLRRDTLEAQDKAECWQKGQGGFWLGTDILCICRPLFLRACDFASCGPVRYKKAMRNRLGAAVFSEQPFRIYLCVFFLPFLPLIFTPTSEDCSTRACGPSTPVASWSLESIAQTRFQGIRAELSTLLH